MARSINDAPDGKVFTKLEFVIPLSDDPQLSGVRIQIAITKKGVDIKEIGRKEWTRLKTWSKIDPSKYFNMDKLTKGSQVMKKKKKSKE